MNRSASVKLERANQVGSYDFVTAWTHERRLRLIRSDNGPEFTAMAPAHGFQMVRKAGHHLAVTT